MSCTQSHYKKQNMIVEALRIPRGTHARHPSFGAILRSPTNKILLVLGRASNKWSLPKGHANPGESPFDCIVREVYEETGYQGLTVPQRSHRLKFGVFYEFLVPEEFEPHPVDQREIAEGRWFTFTEAAALQMNSDTNAFIQAQAQLYP